MQQAQVQNLVDLQQVVVEQVEVDLQDKDQVHLEVQEQPTLAVVVEEELEDSLILLLRELAEQVAQES